jgi:hypothetical protein
MPYSYRTGTAASGVCICMFVCIIGFFRPGRKISDTRSAFYCNGSISQIHTNERGAEIKARPRSDLLVVRVCVCVCVCARHDIVNHKQPADLPTCPVNSAAQALYSKCTVMIVWPRRSSSPSFSVAGTHGSSSAPFNQLPLVLSES